MNQQMLGISLITIAITLGIFYFVVDKILKKLTLTITVTIVVYLLITLGFYFFLPYDRSVEVTTNQRVLSALIWPFWVLYYFPAVVTGNLTGHPPS